MESGIETARAIGFPTCRKVVLIPGCGHSMDDDFAEKTVAAIVENCRFAEDLFKRTGGSNGSSAVVQTCKL